MKETQIIYLLIFILFISCKKKTSQITDSEQNKIELDTTKLYRKINIAYTNENDTTEEYQGYVSKKKDTFWNEWRFYEKGILDSSKSKFYELNVEELKGDSILKGRISFFSPADSIAKEKVYSRSVTFLYLQKINDSMKFKEIKTDKNIIEFDYKDYGNLEFVGYISDIRFIKIDSLSTKGKILANRNYFAIDSELYTNNPFVDLLK